MSKPDKAENLLLELRHLIGAADTAAVAVGIELAAHRCGAIGVREGFFILGKELLRRRKERRSVSSLPGQGQVIFETG